MSTTRFEPDRSWLHALSSPDCQLHQLVLALDDERIVGWCRIFPKQSVSTSRIGELGIGVVGTYCGNGLGKELIVETLIQAFDYGFEKIILSVALGNTQARKLFRNKGFVPGSSSNGCQKMTLDINSIMVPAQEMCPW